MPARRKSSAPQDTTAHLGFEAKLWLAATQNSEGRRKMNDKLQTTNGMATGNSVGSFHTLPFRSFDIRPIRRALIVADLVDCMVALPGASLGSTQPLYSWN